MKGFIINSNNSSRKETHKEFWTISILLNCVYAGKLKAYKDNKGNIVIPFPQINSNKEWQEFQKSNEHTSS